VLKNSGNNMTRKIDERMHFDQWLGGKGNGVIFYDTAFLHSILRDVESYANRQFDNLKNKKLLYFGCGVNLKTTLEFVDKGAKVFMVDISPKSIEFLLKKIRILGIEQSVFPMIMDCENLNFCEGAFDAIYGRAILHHLNLRKAMNEVQRVLKKGGVAVFIEPLAMNPLINLYRKLTPGRRTPHEKPFHWEDFKLIGSTGFSNFKHEEFTLFCNVGILLNSILKVPERLAISYKKLKRLDDFVLSKIPFLRKYCWNTVLVMTR
jgi:SAM-dependent methyltransferase